MYFGSFDKLTCDTVEDAPQFSFFLDRIYNSNLLIVYKLKLILLVV